MAHRKAKSEKKRAQRYIDDLYEKLHARFDTEPVEEETTEETTEEGDNYGN